MTYVTFTPALAAVPLVPGLDARLSAEFMRRGGCGAIIAQLPEPVEMTPDFPPLQLVKHSGDDQHRVPRPLEAFARAAACHQYSVSAFARDKIGILIWRMAEMGDPEQELLASMVHAHSLPRTAAQQEIFDRFYKQIGLGAAERALIANDLALHEYTYTDAEPTFYQSAPAPADLQLRHEMAGTMTDEAAVPLARAPVRAALFTTSQVFHRAPRAAEIAPENIGRMRLFAHLMYLPMKSMAARLG